MEAIELPEEVPAQANSKAYRQYRQDVDKKNRLFNQSQDLAKKSHEAGCGDGSYALARVVLADPANADSLEGYKKAVQLWEIAAERHSIQGVLSLAVITRSKALSHYLSKEGQNATDLLALARSLDIFGQNTSEIEEFAEQWRTEDAKTTEDKAAYDLRLKSAKLFLLDWNWGDSGSDVFVKVNGRVKNISSENLRNVTAVVTFFTDEGKFITSEEALISFNPVLPDQTSPFELIVQRNPLMKSASIDFKFLLGGTISWVKERTADE